MLPSAVGQRTRQLTVTTGKGFRRTGTCWTGDWSVWLEDTGKELLG